MDVKLANMEANVFAEDQKALKFQFSQSSFLADYADPINFLESFQTGNAMNRTGWSNDTYDQLIKKSSQEADEQKETASFMMQRHFSLKKHRSFQFIFITKCIYKKRAWRELSATLLGISIWNGRK